MKIFLKTLVAFISVFFVTSACFAQDNLILDPSFEQNPHASWGDWKDYGPGLRKFDITEKSHSGAQSYKVTVADSASRWNSDIALQEDILGIEGSDKFEASTYLLIPQDKPLSEHVETYLEIIFYDGKGKAQENELGKFQSRKYGYREPVPNWTELKISGTAPQGAKDCKLQLVILPLPYLSDDKKSEESYSGIVYFDDVKLINKSKILR